MLLSSFSYLHQLQINIESENMSMLNSAEYEIYHAHKCQNANN